ncbi:Uncharacterized conserved protein [Brevundimonas diminuta]|uniref:DUF4139 domain-containing protein n=1 Tax=Brevundimonas diminuta TaxID=293 RepID=UPI000207F58E|nr:DUF4139 domain-containing protein [Brevundimonas diminuta]EGF95104.1 conserved protein [Brevundimonas diminuta ATCC 11568]OWR16693.1 DUF4139 domain-containing protein [Brevundimonas diminuta]WQE46112.1 DUF4139 domain-containing protein [Brevundimonas diminuta]SPU48442.1 Uncharacterized conserved protein [Brevundimonas diminuta]SUW15353.1 Uncharacterized conserved protein [Brevundimonas diminuta]
MIRAIGPFALALLLAAPAAAQQVEEGPGGPDRVSLTVYNQNIALVEDVRNLNVPAGRSRQEFPGVSASIRPETVGLSGRGLSVVEQNFDYDLLTPGKLMESAVGNEIGIVRTNPGSGAQSTERARVLAANQGVVLQIGDRIEVLRDDGVPTRVIFDRVPQNLRPRPTLSVTLDAEGAGRRETTLSYLTSGLTWKADYVARFDEKAGKLDLTGWVTLTNNSGATFSNAQTRVVAGDVNLINQGGYNPRPPVRVSNTRGNGTQSGGEGALADVYVYPLPEAVTVANNQTKQVGLIDAAGVPATKRYLRVVDGFYSAEEPIAAEVGVIFANGSGDAARALPAGVIRVYVKDEAGEPRFIGESQVDHSPAGAEIVVTTGDAFDVTVQPRLVSSERVSKRLVDYFRTRYVMEYTVRNARPEPVTVEVRQRGLGRDTELTDQSITGEMRDARTVVWRVPVPANGETKLTATITTGG